ncbi:MAG: signal peptide peptidase SppA, partial [Pseudomonadota bacterium]
GKHVTAHSQGFFTTGPSSLRAISAADEIWIQPGSDISVSGVTFETLFMKDLLDNLHVVAEIEALYEYKNAPNQLKESDYTEPHREAMTALASSIWQTSLADLAEDRSLDQAFLVDLFADAPFSADAAVEARLLDKLGWPEEALEAARTRDGDGNVFELAKYDPPSVRARAPRIAIVGGEGAITTGANAAGGPFGEGTRFASDTIASAIIEAGNNKRVEAIVFRVDSPGGSPTASDQIWRAIEQVQEKGKPVVISMGSLAASGGYYVSTGADHIIANDTTITGSIGIFGGKQTISEGLEIIGVNPRTISVGGAFADAYGTDPFTEAQRAELFESLRRGYERFTRLVAEGREMSIDEVHAVAKGRVWSGNDALEQGLVDEIGSFLDAIDKAKELAGIDAETDVRLVTFPARKAGLEALGDLFGASAEAARVASVLATITGDERLNAALTQMKLMQGNDPKAFGPILIEH